MYFCKNKSINKKIIDHLYWYWVNTCDIPSLNMWSVSLGSWLQGNPQGWEAAAYLHPTSNMKARSRWRSHHGLAKSNLIECKSVCAALLILLHRFTPTGRQFFKFSSLFSLDVKMVFFYFLSLLFLFDVCKTPTFVLMVFLIGGWVRKSQI